MLGGLKTLTFSSKAKPTIALLLKQQLITDTKKQEIGLNYFLPISKSYGSKLANSVIAIGTYQPIKGKVKKRELVAAAEEIIETCETLGITTIICADPDYFKYLAGVKVVEKHIGESFQCVQSEGIRVLPSINYQAVSMFPEKQKLLDKANESVASYLKEGVVEKVEHEFESYEFITDIETLGRVLESIKDKPVLACDIEATGLYLGHGTEITSIAFAWDEYNAITIAVNDIWVDGTSKLVSMVKQFLLLYKGQLLFHNGLYDMKHIVYRWFMEDLNDMKGMHYVLDNIPYDDTMIAAFIELNSTVRPQLGLKPLSYDLLGDYEEDVTDVLAVPVDDMAVYNAKDVCGTMYVYNKYKQAFQKDIYTTIMKPSYHPLLQMMINGMPIDLDEVAKVHTKVEAELRKADDILATDNYVRLTELTLNAQASEKYNKTHKVARKSPEEFSLKFNPASPNQLRILLFDIMGFEPVDFTKTKLPKTDRKSIEEFHRYASPSQKPTLDALMIISKADIIRKTFIPAFENLSINEEGYTKESASGNSNYSLHGSLNLGGTQSGRLSSKDPNMQNLPSGSEWGKAVKACFIAPEGFLFAGADFNALEDRIGAILSKDPVKRKENLLGFDGHCLRALKFFPEELGEAGLDNIDPDDPASVNRIKEEAGTIRNNAKPVSFLKQYGGGAKKIQQVLKCTMQRAEEISNAYDDLYCVTLSFNARNVEQAKRDGYMECAFGLRLLTPRINAKDSGVAAAEARSANNAKTQSWGMLMNRAFIEFNQRIKDAGYEDDIRLCNTIHDAVYFIIREKAEIIAWANTNLIECMEWQDHPDLKSDIHLGAELDIGRSWATMKTLKNKVTVSEVDEFMKDL